MLRNNGYREKYERKKEPEDRYFNLIILCVYFWMYFKSGFWERYPSTYIITFRR